jgi:hypothetical protein
MVGRKESLRQEGRTQCDERWEEGNDDTVALMRA